MTAEGNSSNKTRVLFIDDRARITGAHAYVCVAELSEDGGFDVTVLDSFTSAEEHLGKSREPEDIVVLDLMFPMDDLTYDLNDLAGGYTILREHLRLPGSSYRKVPVLINTSMPADKPRAEVEDFDRTWVTSKTELPAYNMATKLRRILELVRKLDSEEA